MTITISFRFSLPWMRSKKLAGGHAVFFIYTGFCVIGIWRGKAVGVLSEAIRGIANDPEWLTLNAPAMRHARRRAMAKVRAEYLATQRHWLDRAYEQIGELQQKLTKEQADNYAMSRVIARMGRENVQ